ncbi:MAG: hypothetical protein ABIJ09_05310 [Pseudomonadota bacterium]
MLIAVLPLRGMEILGCMGENGDDAGVEQKRDAGGGTDAATGSDAATGTDSATSADAATGTDTATGVDSSPGTDAAAGRDSASGSDSATATDAAVADSSLPDTTVADAAPATDPPPGTWTTQAISPYTAIFAESVGQMPRVAINASGDALVTWSQNEHPFFAERIGGVWSFLSDVHHHIPVAGESGTVLPGLADNGDAAISWAINSPAAMIMHSTKASGTWSHPTQNSDRYDYAGGIANWPSMQLAGDGTGLLIWKYFYNGMVAATASAGAWAQPGVPEANYLINVGGSFTGGSSAGKSGVGVGNGGNMVAAWIHTDGAGYVVHMAHRIGSWSLGTRISPPPGVTVGGMESPKVAVGNNGDALVTWFQQTDYPGCGGCGALYLSEYTGSVWTHPADSGDIFSLTDTTVKAFADGGFVGIADNGGAVVIWRQFALNYTDAQIYVAERTAGVWHKPGPDEYIHLPGGANGTESFHATMGRNGDVLIVRTGRNATQTRTQTYAIQRINGEWYIPLSPLELLDLGSGGNTPFTAIAANGQAIIATSAYDPVAAQTRIWIAEYQPDEGLSSES